MQIVLVFLEALYASTLLFQLPGNSLLRGLDHESEIFAALTTLAFAALVAGGLTIWKHRWAKRAVLTVAALGSLVFAALTLLAIPLVLLASDVSGRGPLGHLWLALGLQPLVLAAAIFWRPEVHSADPPDSGVG